MDEVCTQHWVLDLDAGICGIMGLEVPCLSPGGSVTSFKLVPCWGASRELRAVLQDRECGLCVLAQPLLVLSSFS